MKILVGNNKLSKPGGSETYAYALVAELIRREHEVRCVASGRPGIVSEKINELGVDVHFGKISGKYDLALLSHSSSILLSENVKAFKIQTCHGIFPKLEQPVLGMDAYVSISEEVAGHLQSKGFDSTIIYNGIDCNRYREQHQINDELSKVLSLVQNDELNKTIAKVCQANELGLIVCNKFQKKRKWKIEELMDKVDLVISLGRGCYEAMAMGRNVFVLDNRSYIKLNNIGDGMVNTRNVRKFLKYNCSGRYSNRQFGEKEIGQEFLKYDRKEGERLQKFAIQHLNIRLQVEKYLDLIK